MKKANLLWVDLEMTGLDPKKDRILEVAAIATDWNFEEISRYVGVKKVSKSLIDARMTGQFWEKYSDVKAALIEQNTKGKKSDEIEGELLQFINQYFAKDKPVLLAGNSIHQDRKFIENEWPKLNAKLHYRMLDVSAWKVLFDGKFHKKFIKPESHRALDDINGSIEEIKYYLKFLKV